MKHLQTYKTQIEAASALAFVSAAGAHSFWGALYLSTCFAMVYIYLAQEKRRITEHHIVGLTVGIVVSILPLYQFLVQLISIVGLVLIRTYREPAKVDVITPLEPKSSLFDCF